MVIMIRVVLPGQQEVMLIFEIRKFEFEKNKKYQNKQTRSIRTKFQKPVAKTVDYVKIH